MTDEELKQLVESNARAIQAMIEARVTDRLEHEERIRLLEETQRDVARATLGLTRMLGSLDEDRPIILRRLMAIENKIDRLLEDRRD